MSIGHNKTSTLRSYANITLLDTNNNMQHASAQKLPDQEELENKEEYEYAYKRYSNLENQILQDTNQGQQSANILKIQKKLTQKRSEAELWKQKYENQIGQMLQIKQNYEKEIKQFQREVRSLLDRIDELQLEKGRVPFDASETNMRKMREMIDQKNDEIVRYQQQGQNDDMEIKRLLDDNEQLRSTIASMERQSEHQHTMQMNQQYGELDLLEREIEQLHKLLDVKNDEIESILNENLSQKELYESELEQQRMQYDRHLCELKVMHRDEIDGFEHQLEEMHRKEISRLNHKLESRTSELERENQKLRELSEFHSSKIQQLQQDSDYLRKEADVRQGKLVEAESLRNRIQFEFEDRVRRIQGQLSEDLKHQVAMCQERDGTIGSLQRDIEELSHAISYMEEERAQYEDVIQRQKLEVEQLRLRIYEIELDKNRDSDSMQKQFDACEQHNRERIRILSLQIENYDLEVKRAKEIVDAKSNEIDNLLLQLNLLERENRRSKDEVEDLRARLIHDEKVKLQVIDNTVDAHTQGQIDNLKNILNLQINNLHAENRELKLQLERKNMELHETNQRLMEILRKNSLVKLHH